MDRRRQIVSIFLVLAMVLLVACAPNTIPAPAPQVPASGVAAAPAPAPGAPARPAWQEQWDTVLAATKKEGRVVIATTLGSEIRTLLTKGIKDAFGLGTEVLIGRSDELMVKLSAERRVGLYLEDVHVGSTATIVNSLKAAGMLEPIDSALLLPEVTEPKLWYNGNFPWVDADHMGVAFSLYPSRAIVINTNLVKPDEIKSWRDLLNPKWKGRLVLNDPTLGGTGQLAMLALDEIMGWDYVKELAKAEPIIMRDQRQQMEWLAHGKISIVIAPKVDLYPEFLKVGAPIAAVEPVEGIWISVMATSMFKKAPHPNAAKVFLNWLLSKDGQTLFSNTMLQQSARVDISTAGLPPDLIRKPGMKYSPGISTEAGLARRLVTDKLAKELFEPLIMK